MTGEEGLDMTEAFRAAAARQASKPRPNAAAARPAEDEERASRAALTRGHEAGREAEAGRGPAAQEDLDHGPREEQDFGVRRRRRAGDDGNHPNEAGDRAGRPPNRQTRRTRRARPSPNRNHPQPQADTRPRAPDRRARLQAAPRQALPGHEDARREEDQNRPWLRRQRCPSFTQSTIWARATEPSSSEVPLRDQKKKRSPLRSPTAAAATKRRTCWCRKREKRPREKDSKRRKK